MDLSIIIPVFWEEKNIIKTLNEIKKKVKTACEILLIYDFEKDPTIPVVKKYLKETKDFNIKLIKNSFGNGRGVVNAVKTGFKKAQGKAIAVVMADLSDDISKIDLMYQQIKKGYDIVCGSRYMPGGQMIGGPFVKKNLSRLAGLSAHFLFKIPTHDVTNAFKMYKKKVVDEINIESTGGFEYNFEIIVKAFKKGYKITEIPTSWQDRTEGKSKFKLIKWLPKYIKWYFYLLKT
ncbi:MAG: glycosyltransferase [Microgenomates group bacterium]|nr:glycosyltransferase [Microgenomates group bacterium]